MPSDFMTTKIKIKAYVNSMNYLFLSVFFIVVVEVLLECMNVLMQLAAPTEMPKEIFL